MQTKLIAIAVLGAALLAGCASSAAPAGRALPLIVPAINYSTLADAQAHVAFRVLGPGDAPAPYAPCSLSSWRSPAYRYLGKPSMIIFGFCRGGRVSWRLLESYGKARLALLTAGAVKGGTWVAITASRSVSFAGMHGTLESFDKRNGVLPEEIFAWRQGDYSFQIDALKGVLSLQAMESIAASVKVPHT